MAKDCFTELTKMYKDVDPKVIKDILTKVEDIRTSKNWARDFKELRKRTALEIQESIEYKVDQIKARRNIDTFLQNDRLKKGTNEPFRAKAFGSEHWAEGGNDSFQANRASFLNRSVIILKNGIKGIEGVLESGVKDFEIAKAMEEMKAGKSIDGYSPEVAQAARAFVNYNKGVLTMLQEAGVGIRNREDYLFRQSHNPLKIAKVDFDPWYKDLEHNLDWEKTFGVTGPNPKVRSKVRKIYDKIVDGEYENSVGGFGGSRTLHFKGAEGLMAYHEKYGNGTILDTLIVGANSSAKAAAGAQVLGRDHKATWEYMERKSMEGMTPEQKAKFMDTGETGAKRQRDNWYKEMFGYERHPHREMVATVSRNLSLIQAGAKLGTALGSAVGDLGGVAGFVRSSTGMKLPEVELISNFFAMVPKGEREFVGDLLELQFSDLIVEAYDRHGTINGSGKGNPLQRIYKTSLTATGLELQNSAGKSSAALTMAMDFSNKLEKGWDSLDPEWKATMARYGIKKDDWPALMTAREDFTSPAGNKYRLVTPEKIRALGHGDLGRRYSVFLQDTRSGFFEAQTGERAMIAGGYSPDDPAGAVRRLLGQFKGSALATNRVYKRIALNNPDFDGKTLRDAFKNTGAMTLVAGTALEITLLMAAGLVVKDAVKGKKRAIDADLFMDGFSKGAVGLMGGYMLDIARGEYERQPGRFDRSFLQDVAGPTFGQTEAFVDLTASVGKDVISLLKGEIPMTSDTGSRALKILLDNAPGINLPLVKPLLNKAFLTEVQEYVNPGYQTRLERRARREGTQFLFNSN